MSKNKNILTRQVLFEKSPFKIRLIQYDINVHILCVRNSILENKYYIIADGEHEGYVIEKSKCIKLKM